MLNFIEKVTLATEKRHWSLANHYLQQIPVSIPHEETLDSDLNSQQILDLALQVLLHSDFQQRWEVTKVFPKLGYFAVEPLTTLLKNEETDFEVRWFAGRILGQFDNPRVIMTLVEFLQDTEDEELAEIAAQSLANIGNPAIQALAHLLTDETSRLLAAQALSYIRQSDTIAPLLTVVDDPNPQIRLVALEALGSFHDQRVFPVLVQALQDTTAAIRKEAVIALGLQGPQLEMSAVVKHLTPLLYDLNREVCQQAAIALSRLKTEEAVEVLFRFLQSSATPPLFQQDLVRALGWTETTQALDCLQASLSWLPLKVCQEIVTTLGSIGTQTLKPQATKILTTFLDGDQTRLDVTMKKAIAQSLGQLKEKTAQNCLEELSQDRDQGVRLHAIAALKKLSENSTESLA